MSHVIVIAEAGVNHNGDVARAKEMIDRAREAGADVVKFQTAVLEQMMTGQARMAGYAIDAVGVEESQFDMCRKFNFPLEVFAELREYAEGSSIQFLSTPFDLLSIDALHTIGIRLWKIASGEITNFPFLRKIGRLREPVILSTGMCSLGEVEAAIEVLTRFGTPRPGITLLQCNTDYPTAFEDVNLYGMVTLGEAFKLPFGYSDHTQGVEASLAAVALGARVIEKHFTLDRNLPGPDHKASLEPGELAELVRGVRNIEAALGSGIKLPNLRESNNRSIARKIIVAAREIVEGEIFSEDNLAAKRAGEGISPMRWEELIGRKAARNFKQDEPIWI